MKITSVECLVLDEEYPYVILHTDQGITGFGECFRRAPYASKTAIETVFAPLVIGKSPFDSEEGTTCLKRVRSQGLKEPYSLLLLA
ncbi:MAG: hypothetical protein HQ477_01670 [Chloroflexi bacterium]|nr:hypothetical protein [Chloroflexota bacterium]